MSGPDADGVAETEALAAELDAIRRRVLNVIGHELRTPATTLQGLADEVCAATDLRVVTEEVGPALRRNADRLMGLLDQMLVAAGVVTAVPVGEPEPVDLAELLRSRWSALTGTDIAVAGGGVVVVPARALAMAVDQVLANAAQYGEGPPAVEVRPAAGGAVAVVVRSAGPALHPEEVRLAMEPFFRGERAVTSRPGLGLGLAIVRSVLGHLGGAVAVGAGDDGRGLVTTLRLPAGG